MSDYKELKTIIEGLRTIEKYGEMVIKPHEAKDIADAIEQLVKERDAVVADLRLVANNCFEDYAFSACRCCNKNDTCNGQLATGCEFEWRGVQQDNDEID